MTQVQLENGKIDSSQSVHPSWKQKAAMFSERGSASSRLTSMEVLHSTARERGQETELNYMQLSLVVYVCDALHMKSYRSRWGGSSSRAGCWRWFPADTWNSSVAQNTGPWWRKKEVPFVRRNPLLTNQLVTSHIFHRIKLFRSLSLWVLRMGTCKQWSENPENSCLADRLMSDL